MDFFGVRLKNASSNHSYTWELPDCLILLSLITADLDRTMVYFSIL